MGDRELAEGQVWEAVTAASFYKLNNLIVIIDYNKLQPTRFIKDRYNLGNLKKKFEASGWNTFENVRLYQRKKRLSIWYPLL